MVKCLKMKDLLPAAFRLHNCKSMRLVPGAVGPAWCAVKLASSLQIAANRC